MFKVPLFKLNYDEQKKRPVKEFSSNWLTMGQETISLEKEFSKLISNSYSIAVSSCTAAIHLSLLSLSLKKGDEIIVPSLSFVSQINIIKTYKLN